MESVLKNLIIMELTLTTMELLITEQKLQFLEVYHFLGIKAAIKGTLSSDNIRFPEYLLPEKYLVP